MSSQEVRKMAQAGTTSFWSKVQDLIFPHLFSDLTVAGIIYWFTGKQREGTAKDAPYVDVRGELLADMLPRSDYPNLWRRHGEASVAKTENRFVTLLAKVPKRPVDLRKTVFPALEDMSDTEFNQALDALHQDALWQFLERVALHASPAFKAAWEQANRVWAWGQTHGKALDTWLAKQAEAMSGPGGRSAPLVPRMRTIGGAHPVLKIFAWGIGLPIGLILLALIILRIVR